MCPKLLFESGGNYGPRNLDDYRRRIDAAGWDHVMTITRLRDLMGTKQREEWRKTLEDNPPEFTVENVVSTFESLAGQSDDIFRQSLVDVFEALPRDFRSHDGLAFRRRCILTYAVSKSWGKYSWQYSRYNDAKSRLHDLDRAFHKLSGKPWTDDADPKAIDRHPRATDIADAAMNRGETEIETTFFKLRWFRNGNMHVWMTDQKVAEDANRLLAEHYGATLGHMHLHPDERPKS
ncbi:MAG: DUF4942 domain-containing protein [Pseudomonadota bacterium]